MSKFKIPIIVTGVIALVFVIWLAVDFFSKSISTIDHPINAIPDNHAFIYEANSISELKANLENDSSLISKLLQPEYFYKFKSVINFYDTLCLSDNSLKESLENAHLFVSLHFMGIDQFSVLYTFHPIVSHDFDDLARILSPLIHIEEIEIEGSKVLKMSEENYDQKFYLSYFKGVVSITTDLNLMQKTILQIEKSEPLTANAEVARMLKLSDIGKTHLFINHDFFYRLLSAFAPDYREELKSLRQLASRTEFDISEDANLLVLSGYSIFNDSLASYSKILSNHTAAQITHFDVLPSNTIFLMIRAAKDFNTFSNQVANFQGNSEKSRLNEMENKFGFSAENQIFTWINQEISLSIGSGVSNNQNDVYATISATDSREAIQQLDSICNRFDIIQNIAPDTSFYRSYKIRRVNHRNFLSAIFGQQFNDISQPYFFVIKDYVIFSNNLDAARRFIDSWLVGQNLNSTPKFKSFADYRSSKMNLFYYFDLSFYKSYFRSYLHPGLDSISIGKVFNFNNISFVSVELAAENNGAYTSVVLGTGSNQQAGEDLPLGWQEALDAPALGAPFIFTNHNTGNRDLLIFDQQNFLYHIDHEGHIEWKIPIPEAPISKIFQIDFYKNERFQFVFNTPNFIHVIDLNGNRVEQFPFKLPISATGSLSVLDYDGLKDYRILIPLADGKLHNYKLDRTTTQGWVDAGFTANHITPVKHFRIGGKDFLLFSDRYGKVEFANRKGEIRMETKLDFTNNPNSDFYPFDNHLYTTDMSGRLIKIDADGNIDKTAFSEFSNQHLFRLADFDLNGRPDFVYWDQNRLSVYDEDKILLIDTVLNGVSIDEMVVLKAENQSNIRLILHDKNSGHIMFLYQSGLIEMRSEFASCQYFKVEEATKNKLLRLITVNNRVVSNFLIK